MEVSGTADEMFSEGVSALRSSVMSPPSRFLLVGG